MEQNEKLVSRVEDSEFIKKVRDAFADDLEEEATEPNLKYSRPEFTARIVESVRMGEKIKNRGDIRGKFIMICQDFRLLPDEIDQLYAVFFRPEDNS